MPVVFEVTLHLLPDSCYVESTINFLAHLDAAMKHNIIKGILLVFICFINPLWAETQYELNKAACDQLQKADAALNAVYQKIIASYKEDKVFINQLVTAQKKWLEFRDAYVATRFIPQYRDTYGSILSMCQCNMLEKITSDRTKQLQIWLDGVSEGDVCIGSIKVN